MLGLALVACGPDTEKSTDADTSTTTGTATEDPTAGTSEPTSTSEPTTAGETTDGSETATTSDATSDPTVGETETATTTTETTTGPLTTSQGCENFLPPIQPESIEPLTVGVAVEIAFTVPGLEDNTTWTPEGELPAGLEFTVETGVLAGTPTMAGSFDFSLSAAPTMDIPECPTLPAFTQYEIIVNE